MAKSQALNFTQSMKLSGARIVNSDGATTLGTTKTLFTAGSDDTVIKAITVRSTDSAAKVVDLIVNDGTNPDFIICSINVPLTSGSTGLIATVDMLNGTLIPALPYDASGKRVLPLPAGYSIKVALTQVAGVTAVTSGRELTFVCMAENY